MPPFKSLLARLVKSDRRKEWKALKARHEAAIQAKHLKFGAGLGPALDKVAKPLAVVNKLFVAEKLNRPALQKVVELARPLAQIATSYQDQVKGLGGPAEKELGAFLQAVVSDGQGWEQVLDMFEETDLPVGAPAATAVKALYGPLGAVAAQLENLGKSLPAAQAEVANGRTQTARPTTKPVKLSGAEWAHVRGLGDDVWTRTLRTKIDGVLEVLERVTNLRAGLEQDVAPLLTAVNRFDAKGNYDALKERAETVAKGSLSAFARACKAFLDTVQDDEIRTELGFAPGLPYLQLTRATNAVRTAFEASVELFTVTKKLP